MATLVSPTTAAGSADALLGTYKRAPMELVRGEGVTLWDAEGNAYLDFTSGIAVNALGYGDAGLVRAIQEGAASGIVHASNLFRTAPGEQLAAWLVERSFASKAFFCNSGAEANEGAFKFARRWARAIAAPPGDELGVFGACAKHEIVSLRGAFHGRTLGVLAATDRPAYRAPFRPLAGGVTIAERDIRELDVVLDGERVAAVIVEPIQGEGGVRVVAPGLLKELRAMTTERRIALVFDEIQCGLGRLGTLFAYETTGVEPDMVTLAKPLAGGLPMGAILVNAEIAAAIKPGDHGTTFGGGPLVAHVANYVLSRLGDPALLAHVRETGAWFGEQLRALGERTGKIRAVRGAGLMWGVDTHESAGAIVERARQAGLLVLTAGEYTLRILPPLVISREDLARGLSVLEGVLTSGAPPK
ncbi:Acetylornithine/succinyldiaminopimelate aminotransferase [Gemmatirosa kalamazoonensis]|uniref:Acetylornithine/succinyldiaminopimelate aminotransferase n=1 Tax=Gemmatirosa kalamazoonensis TaxID=861299 RepID=W0REJ4_9BACT|nr:acetylornithine transaminase [Gemmatirosa kalamazoonensis]AHG88867.1 Acetylornithine/succinyldiaminopimelate aminotransferase [Gemmatirosa kalamazoonensis]